ncbi:hypothetical protein CYOC110262_25035 [Cytobacillus oceanisediminis]|uniref:Uncharacterized protein n=1 Tax=Cytobacillus oceanisediminis TaxID=665099 RepID=A0A562J4H3_9BACI|nr:hypothetical protein [Cytobacillus oceanisediminis]TWH77824.1 hypothetical protein IQ19_05577 [Cytobacillus oceanisediminis]
MNVSVFIHYLALILLTFRYTLEYESQHVTINNVEKIRTGLRKE